MADGSELRMLQSICPSPETTRDFRNALGRYATGVTVVTADSEIGPLGITANSFASVSLDPALVLWSPAKSSRRFDAFVSAKHYAIHILAADQQSLCRAFTRDGTAFDGLDWHLNAQKVPLINDCLARFECTQIAVHDAGDHAIILGEVTQAGWRDGAPLIFSQGSFGAFSTDA